MNEKPNKDKDLLPSIRKKRTLYGGPRDLKKSDFDRVVAYMHDPENNPLTERQQNTYKRWKTAYDLLVDPGFLDNDIKKRIVEQYEVKEAVALADIRNAKRLYAYQPYEKKWLRAWLLEIQRRNMKDAFEAGDVKEVNKGIANIINLMGLDKDDVETPTIEQLEANNYVVQVNVKNQQFNIDLSQAPTIPLDQQADLLDAYKDSHPLDDYNLDEDEGA